MIEKIKQKITPAYTVYKRWYYYLAGYCGVGDPLRVYEISPKEIQYTIGSSSFEQSPGVFEIKSGDWDLRKRPIEENPKLSMFKKHFQESVPWNDI